MYRTVSYIKQLNLFSGMNCRLANKCDPSRDSTPTGKKSLGFSKGRQSNFLSQQFNSLVPMPKYTI